MDAGEARMTPGACLWMHRKLKMFLVSIAAALILHHVGLHVLEIMRREKTL